MIKLKAKLLKSWSAKSRGLIGKNKIVPVYFETRFGIHTFGMKIPIDVYILDTDSRIIKIHKNLNPGRVLVWNPKFFRVIETPVNYLNMKPGDKVKLELQSKN